MSAKMDEPEEFFGSIVDAEAFAKEAYRKAAEYLAKGEALKKENDRLRALLRSPILGTDVKAIRSGNELLSKDNAELQKEIMLLKRALSWIFQEGHIVEFAKQAIPNGSRKDALMKNSIESRFVLKEADKPWVVTARDFWREVNYSAGMINPNKRNRRSP